MLEATAIEHETKFGNVYIKITIDDFNAMGFAFGDSLNITFYNYQRIQLKTKLTPIEYRRQYVA